MTTVTADSRHDHPECGQACWSLRAGDSHAANAPFRRRTLGISHASLSALPSGVALFVCVCNLMRDAVFSCPPCSFPQAVLSVVTELFKCTFSRRTAKSLPTSASTPVLSDFANIGSAVAASMPSLHTTTAASQPQHRRPSVSSPSEISPHETLSGFSDASAPSQNSLSLNDVLLFASHGLEAVPDDLEFIHPDGKSKYTTLLI